MPASIGPVLQLPLRHLVQNRHPQLADGAARQLPTASSASILIADGREHIANRPPVPEQKPRPLFCCPVFLDGRPLLPPGPFSPSTIRFLLVIDAPCEGECVKAHAKGENRTFRLIIHLRILAKGEVLEAVVKGE